MLRPSASSELASMDARAATADLSSPGRKRSSRACLECRLAKTKCEIADDQEVCQRCAKFSFDCRFVRHHRGRKPVSKLATFGGDAPEVDDQDAGSEDDSHVDIAGSDSPSTSAAFVRPRTTSTSDRPSTVIEPSKSAVDRASTLHELDTHARRRIWEMLAQKIPQRGSTYTFVSKGEVAHDELDSTADARGRNGHTSASDSSASTSATQHFASTFRNLVRPVDRRTNTMLVESTTHRYPQLPETVALFGPKDPVELGLVSLAAAQKLYNYFFLHINPWAMIFDPHLVSHDSLRAASPHLYTTALFLASRYILPSEHETGYQNGAAGGITANTSRVLGAHARSLTVIAFALGDRRMETGVAMYLSSVWKEADDNFTILYCSYAAKIMSDISTELLSLHAPDSNTSRSDQQQLRLRRHQQRQFLFHFIQEHTHLLHFAPRPNFDRGPSLLRNLLAWSDDALATEDDVLLCADIDSVLLQTKYKSIMETAQAQELERETGYRGGSECFLLLQSFMDELEGWSSRWEYQATKIDRRFADSGGERGLKTFSGRLSLQTRMSLLNIMRSSLVMQISSIAFRASLRDINRAKSSTAGAAGVSLPSTLSLLSTLDDRAEHVYYTCLDSALNLLIHTTQMPSSVLRHAQDMIMVLAPHAALLATYLISLPLPSVPQMRSTADVPDKLHVEHDKAKTRIRRRKVYERKSLELMRDTRECFRRAVVRSDDHVELCAQYFDSLLNVIEGETESKLKRGPTHAGMKRSRNSFESAHLSEVGVKTRPDARSANIDRSRSLSAGLGSGSNANVDSLAAETLLNLHSESQPSSAAPPDATFLAPAPRLNLYPSHDPMPSSDLFTSTMAGTGMFGNFAASPSMYGLSTPMLGADYTPMAAGSGVASNEGTGASTPVDWTWLQSFLDVPEFTWM